MQIRESKAAQSATLRILLATGLGAVFGFQSWRLATYGFVIPTPWYWSSWVFLSHVLMGFSVGATAWCIRWWGRGLALGLVFAIPPALGGHALGLGSVPYGLALVISSLMSALLIALISDSTFPRGRPSAGTLQAPERPSGATTRKCDSSPGNRNPQAANCR